jgi:outer membrane protein OmpA-like peptidoglycan-associated protein
VGLSHSSAETSPLELLLGLRWGALRNLEMTVGAGPGLTNGFGTPRYRLLAALSYVPGSRPVQVASAPVVTPAPPPPAPAPPPPLPPLVARADETQVDGHEATGTLVVNVEAPPPPPPPAAAVVDKGKIHVLEKVNFATNMDNVLPESLHVLDDVFQIMSSDNSIRRMRIEAHTDNRGNASYNKELSERRAKWVKEYLIQKGLDSSRLDSSGFGQARPIATNDTPEGRASNRRVEFAIIE